MENYIVINGKKVELTEEQLKVLKNEIEKKNPFMGTKDKFYEVDADCYVNRNILQQQTYHETLNRLLWHHSMEHDGDKIDWEDYHQYKWYIYRMASPKCYGITYDQFSQNLGMVYFYSREAAELALEEVVLPFLMEHPDFKFYGADYGKE